MQVSGKKSWSLVGGIALAVFVVGAAAGASGQANQKPITIHDTKVVAGPTVTSIVTRTVTGPVVNHYITKNVDVPGPVQTPQSCRDALAHADVGFSAAGDFAQTMSDFTSIVTDTFTQLGNGDVSQLDAETQKIYGIRDQINSETARLDAVVGPYQSAKAACLAH